MSLGLTLPPNDICARLSADSTALFLHLRLRLGLAQKRSLIYETSLKDGNQPSFILMKFTKQRRTYLN